MYTNREPSSAGNVTGHHCRHKGQTARSERRGRSKIKGKDTGIIETKKGVRIAKSTEKAFKIKQQNGGDKCNVRYHLILGNVICPLILKFDLQSFIIKSAHINDLCGIFRKMILLTGFFVVVIISPTESQEIDTCKIKIFLSHNQEFFYKCVSWFNIRISHVEQLPASFKGGNK